MEMCGGGKVGTGRENINVKLFPSPRRDKTNNNVTGFYGLFWQADFVNLGRIQCGINILPDSYIYSLFTIFMGFSSDF